MDIKDTMSYEEFQKDLKLPEPVIRLHNVFFRDFAGSLLSICFKTSGFPALQGIIVRGDVFYDNHDGNGIGAPALYIYYPESNNFQILKISGENASFIYDRIMECQHKRRRRIMLREFVTYLYYCMSFALGCFGFFSPGRYCTCFYHVHEDGLCSFQGSCMINKEVCDEKKREITIRCST